VDDVHHVKERDFLDKKRPSEESGLLFFLFPGAARAHTRAVSFYLFSFAANTGALLLLSLHRKTNKKG
jgi:hypothetical protein